MVWSTQQQSLTHKYCGITIELLWLWLLLRMLLLLLLRMLLWLWLLLLCSCFMVWSTKHQSLTQWTFCFKSTWILKFDIFLIIYCRFNLMLTFNVFCLSYLLTHNKICGNCPLICFWSFISRMEFELRQTSTITLRLANLITTHKIYLGCVCQEVQTDNIGKANCNHGWGVSIPCTYNIAGCPVSSLLWPKRSTTSILTQENLTLKLNILIIPLKNWFITSAYLNPENLKKS